MSKERETFVEQLECVLTKEELAMKSNQLATKIAERKALEDKKKTVNADLKLQKENLETAINQLAREVSTGKETRAVECIESFDFEHNSADKIRTDTNEVVDRRPMHPGERQAELDYRQGAEESEEEAAARRFAEEGSSEDLQTKFDGLAAPDNDQSGAADTAAAL